MNQCEEMRAQMSFYLDDELQSAERAVLEAHLSDCENCLQVFTSERRFLEMVRGVKSLHLAGPELKARVERILSEASATKARSQALPSRVRRFFSQTGAPPPGLISRRALAVTALVAVAGIIGLWSVGQRKNDRPRNPPSEFAMMAVDTHQRHLRGQLPFEVASDVPEEISGWFAGKVPFSLKLPNYQESSGQEKLYDLKGARLVGYKNDYAAYVAYVMQKRPIGLVVTSGTVTQPSGGEEIVSKGMTFHYDAIDGLKVITWTDRGLTYALVSDLEERGQQSCIVCHQGTKDQNFIEGLKP